MNRIKKGLEFSGDQFVNCVLFSLLNVFALMGNGGPWWLFLLAAGFWPLLAFFCNMADI